MDKRVIPSCSHVLSLGCSATHARRLYVSRIANFRVSDPKYGVAHKDVRYRQPSQGWRVWREPHPTLGDYTASLLCVVGTERCVAQVPLYESRLANFRVSDPIHGVAHKDVRYRQPSQGWREGTVVSTEGGVTQVPLGSGDTRMSLSSGWRVWQSPRVPSPPFLTQNFALTKANLLWVSSHQT